MTWEQVTRIRTQFPGQRTGAVWWALGMTTAFMVVGMIGGTLANSLTLISGSRGSNRSAGHAIAAYHT